MINKDLRILGKRIQKVRKDKKLTQEKLSEMANISQNYLSNIETGRDICSFTTYLDLANLLCVSMDFLLGENLKYNQTRIVSGKAHASLLYRIGDLSETDCEHLLKYIELLKEYDRA